MTPAIPDKLRASLDRTLRHQCESPLLEGVRELLAARPSPHVSALIVQTVSEAVRTTPLGQIGWWFSTAHTDFRALHALNACRLACMLAHHEGYDPAVWGQAGLLYDIGMYDHDVEQAVLHDRSLDDDAMTWLRAHAEAGAHRLEALGFAPEVAAAAREHHERPDGSGYPDGLTRNRLSTIGVMFQLIDSFLGQVEPRPFRMRRTAADAMNRLLLQAQRGHYDLPIFRKLAASLGMVPLGSVVALTTGEFALVCENNELDPSRPSVQVLSDSLGNPRDPALLRLSDRPRIEILEAY